jgi:GT2 family glycosyltransferase
MVGSRVMEPGDPGHVCSRGLKWRRFLASTLGVDANAPSPHVPDVADIEARIDAPSGASFYVTRACIDAIGLMEDLYFLYFEDLEWGLRAKAACGVSYAYDSVVPHIGGSTIGSASDRRKRSKVAVYYEFRNRLTFVRRNHPAWFWWTAAITAIHGGEFLLVGASENFKMAMRAVWAGIRKETGRADHVFPQLADRVDGQCVQPEVS